jgi:hypothetical protein
MKRERLVLDWFCPDAIRALSPWLRWCVVTAVVAGTGFMLVYSYPLPVLLYIDAVVLGFGWAVLFHIAADLGRVSEGGAPSWLRSGRELDVAQSPATAKQLATRGWQLFSASLLLGVAGMATLVFLFAGT